MNEREADELEALFRARAEKAERIAAAKAKAPPVVVRWGKDEEDRISVMTLIVPWDWMRSDPSWREDLAIKVAEHIRSVGNGPVEETKL